MWREEWYEVCIGPDAIVTLLLSHAMLSPEWISPAPGF